MKNGNILHCIVLDDEIHAVKLLADYVMRTNGLELVLKTTDPTAAVDLIHNGNVDLIFLDIQMPNLTGIEVMNIIRQRQTKVILTTAYPEYALTGFEYDAIDYLMKPITFERFLIAVNKAKKRMNLNAPEAMEPDHIFIKVEHRLQKILFSSIHYIEGLGDYISFHTSGGRVLSLERMKHIELILPQHLFLRIHKSYIINTSHIDFVERGRIVIDKNYLPIGETYKDVVNKKLGLKS
ncbi:LytR/AlgR family response regulator transcription factor [Pedobacter panaciterrae]